MGGELFQTEYFSTAGQLLSEMEEERFTIYILDIEIPDGNGIELAEQNKKEAG